MFKRKQIQHFVMSKLSGILTVIWLFTKQFGAYILTNCRTPFIKLKPLLKEYLKKPCQEENPFLPWERHEARSSSILILFLWETIRKKCLYNWFLLNIFKTNTLKTGKKCFKTLLLHLLYYSSVIFDKVFSIFVIIKMEVLIAWRCCVSGAPVLYSALSTDSANSLNYCKV